MEENIIQVKNGIKAKVLAILSNENNAKDYDVVIRVMRNYDINITDITIEYPVFIEDKITISYKYSNSSSLHKIHIFKSKSATFEEFLSYVCMDIYMRYIEERKNIEKVKIKTDNLSLKAKSKISIIKYRRK